MLTYYTPIVLNNALIDKNWSLCANILNYNDFYLSRGANILTDEAGMTMIKGASPTVNASKSPK
jgi:hypothetical protein